MNSISQIFHRIALTAQPWLTISRHTWQKLSPKNQGHLKFCLTLMVLGMTVRVLPYLAPIRIQDITQQQQAIEFTDRHNLPLGTLLTRDQEHTAVVPLKQVSPYFIQGIIAAEDKGFYQHGALDFKAIVRASLEAIQAKEIVSGASTITMQLARMLDPAPRTLQHKFGEIWLSWRLAAGMSKHEILEAYINRLPMGGNIYGVEAASRIYFGIPAAELNLAQATLLAALPNDPGYLNPYENFQSLKKRQRYVLNRMVAEGYITQNQAHQTDAEAVSLQTRQQGILAAPQFLFWLASQVPPDTAYIKTTIDRSLQQFAEEQVKQIVKNLTDHNAHHAAVLVIDNHTGEVLAYVGSPNYFADAENGRNDGVQALRQPGSTLKPFLYELALEKGIIKPNTILEDIPTFYAIPGAKLYNPTNYNENTFLGLVRVRLALANSLNIPAVRLLEKVGVSTFLERLHQLGFSHLKETPEYYGLGLTLGSGEVTLWELANAYVILANQGKNITLTATHHPLKVQAKLANPNTPDLIQNPQDTASDWLFIIDVLKDRHARAAAFGVDSVLSLPFPTAVKTGTSSDFRDTWTVGFSSDYTVATWVGNFNGERMKQVSGVMGAAPLWQRMMLHLHEHQEPADFLPPAELVQQPICATTGQPPTPDCTSVVLEYLSKEDAKTQNPKIAQSTSEQWTQNPPSLTPKIIFPKNDDYFLMDANQPHQQLKFELAASPTQPVEWRLNGKTISTSSTHSLFWPMTPGNWTLQVKGGNYIDQVNFQVQLDQPKQIKQGFSIVQGSEKAGEKQE